MAEAPDSTPIARPPIPAAPLELAYAPPAKSSNRPLWVLVFGVITSLLALAAVYFIDRRSDTSLMGWYIDYFLPVGAIGVGLVAASGYGIASWKMGVKIRRALLWAMMALLVGCYFSAEYVEFAMHRPFIVVSRAPSASGVPGRPTAIRPLGFWEYFHLTAVNWTWGSDSMHPNEKHEPLGMWGYLFRMGGILGFVLGGAIVPGLLMKKDYCDLCERYMTTRRLAIFPASIPFRKFKKSDTENFAAYSQQQEQMLKSAQSRFNQMAASATAGDVTTFTKQVSQIAPQKKAASKLPRRLGVALIRCRNCSSGYLSATLFSGHGNQAKSVNIAKTPLSPQFIRDFNSQQSLTAG